MIGKIFYELENLIDFTNNFGVLMILILTLCALLLDKLARVWRQYKEKRRERRLEARYEAVFGRSSDDRAYRQGERTVTFDNFHETLMTMTENISKELTAAGFPEPATVTLDQMMAALKPGTRQKLETTFGPIFTGETGEMFTQVLELFKTLMMSNYRLAAYRQKKIASHTKSKLDAEMLHRDLETALEGVKLAGEVRKAYEELEGPERKLGWLISAVTYQQYVVEIMEAQGITDPTVLEAVKQEIPFLNAGADDAEDYQERQLIEAEVMDPDVNNNGRGSRAAHRTGEEDAAQTYALVSTKDSNRW